MTIGGISAPADLVLVGGKIRTPAHPSGFTSAAAIGGGVIRALGSDDEIRELAGPHTRVVNLRGRLAIPAFGDAHVHPVQGGLESLRCNLVEQRSRQDCLDAIAAYSAALPRDAWVLGGGWSMSGFPGGTPTAADLDTVTDGRPAFLPNRDHHSAWVNTAALTLAGVTARTQTRPTGGSSATTRASPPAPCTTARCAWSATTSRRPVAAELTAALLAAQRYLHSLGITSIQDACVGEAGELGMPDAFDTYRRAAADRLLTCRVTGSLWWDRGRGLRPGARPADPPGGGRRRRLLPRHHGQADARRRVRDVHRRDGDAVPGRARPPDGPRGKPVHRARGAGAGRWPAGRPRLPAALSRDRGPRDHDRARHARRTYRRRNGPAAGITSPTCSSSARRTWTGSPGSAWWRTSSRCGPARTSRTRS